MLYLGRVGHIELLPALFAPVCVPESVVSELDMGRLLRRDTVDPRQLDWVTRVSVLSSAVDALSPNQLGMGERAVIAYARPHSGYVAGLDDLQARSLAERLGLTIVGTLGIFLRTKQGGLIVAVQPLLDAVRVQGFRLGSALYRNVLQLAGEAF